ncbi:MAG TPA: monovalent cation/H(+) antiporter subunit G [Candidatus Limnocylindria bacterium]|nr:monovalent cation/H(+) antiporter subunit G [Candidatus Limnocylindria bacterium]
MLEILAALAMLTGTFFMVVTGIGLVRFPDVYTRMHAAGKAGTVGVAMLILAPTLYFGPHDAFLALRGLLAIVFQGLTTPGATYLLAHASYATGYPSHGRTEIDELKRWLPAYSDEEFGHE